MVYIFEDKSDSPLSKLFQYKYMNTSTVKDFIYANGNRGLKKKIAKLVPTIPESDIVCYLDLVYDNGSTVDIFREIRLTYPEVLVVPCICAEYYLLQCIEHSTIVRDVISVSKALSMSKDRCGYPSIKSKGQSLEGKSHEKVCKRVLNNACLGCVKTEGSNIRLDYYILDCLCSKGQFFKCTPKILSDKSREYVNKYPLFPDDEEGVSLDEIYSTINEFLKAHNTLVSDKTLIIEEYLFYGGNT